MKRILSLVLSLILVCSLSIPTLAAEDLDPPLWQQMGFSSREECITYVYGDETAYEAAVQEALERQRWEDDMAADIAAFDPDAYWESDQCQYSWYYDSKEEFMEDWFLETEEEFRDVMLEDWLDQQWDAYQQETLVARTRAELGAPAGQTGVMLDGTYLSFPGGAAPEVVNGVTMVPCGPLLTAFGGTVSHTGSDVVCTLDGAVYRLRSGSDTVAVTAADGTASQIPLGVACYEKNGATYMALRPFAEAMGCDVMWDSTFQTAVLLRREAVIAQLDEQFTVINQLFAAMARDASKNYRTAARMDAKLTMLDSINGDKQYHMDADLELLQSAGALNLKLTMDLSALLEIPVTIFETDIFQVANNSEKSPCYLCARMRRGFLYSKAQELGCNKIALGHHLSDVLETTLLGLFYGAQLQTMPPKLRSRNFPGMELIRPLYCVHEDAIIAWKNYNGLRFLQCACRFTEERDGAADGVGESKRQEMKLLLRELKKTNPNIEKSMFRAIHGVQLDTFPGFKFRGRAFAFPEAYNLRGASSAEDEAAL